MNPRRRQWLGFGIGLAVAGPLAAAARESLQWRERMVQGFGTTLWLRAAHADGSRVEEALDRAAATLRGIESQMSLFDEGSALSQLNRRGRLARPDAALLDVLGVARRVSAASGGTFDVTMQPLWTTWESAHREGRLPTERELAAARARVHWRAVDASAERIWLPKGFALSLNGIAQGHAADAVRAQMQSLGIRHAMLDTGETSVLGQAPGSLPWRFGIEDAVGPDDVAAKAGPADTTRLGPSIVVPDGFAVATSSDRHTRFSPDRRHHHIVDPRSGWSPPHWASVTVVARRAVLADALTKVFFMLPADRLQAEAARWQVQVVAQDRSGRWFDSRARSGSTA